MSAANLCLAVAAALVAIGFTSLLATALGRAGLRGALLGTAFALSGAARAAACLGGASEHGARGPTLATWIVALLAVEALAGLGLALGARAARRRNPE